MTSRERLNETRKARERRVIGLLRSCIESRLVIERTLNLAIELVAGTQPRSTCSKIFGRCRIRDQFAGPADFPGAVRCCFLFEYRARDSDCCVCAGVLGL